ncbi:MAG: hypothetical protein ACREEB_11320 [Caulobacteraceae bacterium]
MDLDRLIARGFGSLSVTAACGFLKCQNLVGCGLEFHSDRNVGLPLTALLGRSHVKVRIKCGSCGFFRVTSPDTVVAKIRADDKTATDTLLISDIAGRIKGACGQCKKRAWAVDVLWPDPNSEGTRRGL